jgi:catechol 2,3-dioxygenase-like lactoylglutathione lyase family enzyme
MIRQLAHLCLYTDRLDEMRRFYTDVLGLRLAFPLNDPAGQPFGFYFDAGHSTFIEVFDRQGAQAMWGGSDARIEPGTAFRHLCFEVTGLDALREQLLARGVDVTEPRVSMDLSRQAWTSDPDGNRIELMEYTASSSQLRRG